MKKLEKSVSINSPIDKVFNYISDPMNNTEWLPSMIEIKDVDLKDEGVGTSYHWIYKMGGIKFSGEKGLRNYLRLSFAYYDVPELEEGARRLGRVIEEFEN